jgi:hypothetical protein
MTSSLNRWFSVLLVSVILAGCQGLPFVQKTTLTETESFAKGVDQYIETGDLQTLKLLPQEYPDGEWGPRADWVIKLAEQQEKCAADNEERTAMREGEQKQQAFLKDQELVLCNQEMVVLRQNNQDLQETIDQLKKLLIDMESRSN